jgi:hypothetical protein
MFSIAPHFIPYRLLKVVFLYPKALRRRAKGKIFCNAIKWGPNLYFEKVKSLKTIVVRANKKGSLQKRKKMNSKCTHHNYLMQIQYVQCKVQHKLM